MDYLIQTKASDWLIFVLVRISSLGIKGCDSNFNAQRTNSGDIFFNFKSCSNWKNYFALNNLN